MPVNATVNLQNLAKRPDPAQDLKNFKGQGKKKAAVEFFHMKYGEM